MKSIQNSLRELTILEIQAVSGGLRFGRTVKGMAKTAFSFVTGYLSGAIGRALNENVVLD